MIKDSISLVAVGDIMLGDHIYGHGVGSSLKTKKPGALFSNVSDTLKKGDIIFGNLECVLSDININNKSLASVSLRGAEKSINELKSAGFNILSIANNHILQHGELSLMRTKELLQQHGIQGIGVSETKEESRKVYVMEIKGVKIGFLAYCLIGDKTAYCSVDSPSEIIGDVKDANAKVDILVVSMHWGNEFIRKPSSQQFELGHAIIDAGAKLILGHHPHVLQGVEKYNGGIIVYSLGNFVFDMWERKMRESMILSVNLSKKGVEKFEIKPVIIEKDFRPCPLEGAEKDKLLSQITGEFLELKDEISYLEEVRACRKYYRFGLVKHLAFNFYRYNPLYLYQIGSDFFNKQRR
ncbi:CapA family protein [Methanosarcina mazei]|nr:CapA family protein [Methanosarcina mazei]